MQLLEVAKSIAIAIAIAIVISFRSVCTLFTIVAYMFNTRKDLKSL